MNTAANIYRQSLLTNSIMLFILILHSTVIFILQTTAATAANSAEKLFAVIVCCCIIILQMNTVWKFSALMIMKLIYQKNPMKSAKIQKIVTAYYFPKLMKQRKIFPKKLHTKKYPKFRILRIYRRIYRKPVRKIYHYMMNPNLSRCRYF